MTDTEELEARLFKVVPKCFDGQCEHYLLEGEPAREVVQFAEREHVDLIVLGTHGRTGLARVLMGSVAENVVRRAPCPVLVVKQPLALRIKGDPT
jgi:universal stress protein A